MARKRLIVNADDIGMSQLVTDAILDCHERGIVTSATMMANMPDAERAARRAGDFPRLGIGIHLCLTQGRPVSPPDKVPQLVDDEGRFLSNARQVKQLWWGSRAAPEVELELTAQVERVLDLGVKPTHFDSHHGVQKRPAVRGALVRLSRRFGIPAARTHLGRYWTAPGAPTALRLRRVWKNATTAHRDALIRWNHQVLRWRGVRTPDGKLTPDWLLPTPSGSKERFLAALSAMPEGTYEMLVHPGADPGLGISERWLDVRREDTALAVDPEVIDAIRRAGIELVDFSAL